MPNLDRFIIDDGRHLPQPVIDEDASRGAGTARFRAACSCGRLPRLPAGTREEALAIHLAHVSARTGPSKGPRWLPESVHPALLVLAMLLICGACLTTAQLIVHAQQLDGAAAKAVTGGSVPFAFLLAFSLMVAVRNYIAPTRA